MTIYTSPDRFIDPTPSAAENIISQISPGLSMLVQAFVQKKARERALTIQKEKEKRAEKREIEKELRLREIGLGKEEREEKREIEKEFRLGEMGLGKEERVEERLIGKETRGEEREIRKEERKRAYLEEARKRSEKKGQAIGLPSDRYEQYGGAENLTTAEKIRIDAPYRAHALKLETEERHEGKAYLSKARESSDQSRTTLKSLNTQLAAVRSGKVGPFSWGNLAKITGFEGFHTPGSAAFQASGKELFRGIMDVFGKRILASEIPIWEGQMAKIGRQKAPNELMIKSMMIRPKVEIKKAQIADRLFEEGVPLGKIEKRTRDELNPYVDELHEEWRNTLTKTLGKGTTQKSLLKESKVVMIDPSGVRRRVLRKDVKKAKEAGYKLER